MKLKVTCQLDYQTYQNVPLIFLLKLRPDFNQTILNEEFIVEPAVPVTEYLDHYGNYCQRMISPMGQFSIKTSALVVTAPTIEVDSSANFVLIQDVPDDVLLYLLPSRYCESDKLLAKASEIIYYLSTGYEMVEAIRQWVRNNIKYAYNYSTPSTSAMDTLDSQIGVCRDLSHLAIALCRSINIPTRFVVGYLYNLEPMDLHAWFEAYVGGKWYTFDATQENTTGGRAVLAYGRDAADVATMTYFGDLQLDSMFVGLEQIEA